MKLIVGYIVLTKNFRGGELKNGISRKIMLKLEYYGFYIKIVKTAK